MSRSFWALCACGLALVAMPAAAELTAVDAFEQLKALDGTWTGEAEPQGAEAEAEAEALQGAVHEIRVSAAGTVVMETMAPGTDHEMINMYHLDGDDLVMTHYCAGGNQPMMRLDRAASSAERLVFDYAGGMNHDSAVDPHIHSAELVLHDGDQMESRWMGWNEGKEAGAMVFHLARSE